MHERKTVVVDEEDFSSLTIMKPFSQEHMDFFITVFEDAYGEVVMKVLHVDALKKRLNFSDEVFDTMVSKF